LEGKLLLYPDCCGQCIVKGEDGREEFCSSLYQCIEKVKEEWMNAKAQFDEAIDKDHIDSLIYKINYCERKFIYLLNLAKKEKLRKQLK